MSPLVLQSCPSITSADKEAENAPGAGQVVHLGDSLTRAGWYFLEGLAEGGRASTRVGSTSSSCRDVKRSEGKQGCFCLSPFTLPG